MKEKQIVNIKIIILIFLISQYVSSQSGMNGRKGKDGKNGQDGQNFQPRVSNASANDTELSSKNVTDVSTTIPTSDESSGNVTLADRAIDATSASGTMTASENGTSIDAGSGTNGNNINSSRNYNESSSNNDNQSVTSNGNESLSNNSNESSPSSENGGSSSNGNTSSLSNGGSLSNGNGSYSSSGNETGIGECRIIICARCGNKCGCGMSSCNACGSALVWRRRFENPNIWNNRISWLINSANDWRNTNINELWASLSRNRINDGRRRQRRIWKSIMMNRIPFCRVTCIGYSVLDPYTCKCVCIPNYEMNLGICMPICRRQCNNNEVLEMRSCRCLCKAGYDRFLGICYPKFVTPVRRIGCY